MGHFRLIMRLSASQGLLFSVFESQIRTIRQQILYMWYKLLRNINFRNDGGPRTTVLQTVPWTEQVSGDQNPAVQRCTILCP